MNGRPFLDTNILVYLFDQDAPRKRSRARQILEGDAHFVLSTQVLQEFYVTVTRKLGKPLREAEAEAAARELAALDVVEVTVEMVLKAVAGARMARLSFWDALIVEAAQARGCDRLLTEDLQNGRRFGDVRVENPFL